MGCSTVAALAEDLRSIDVDLAGGGGFSASRRPPADMIDRWAETAALGEPEARALAIWAIREAALAAGIVPASVQEPYLVGAAAGWRGAAAPARNLRGWMYQTCRAVCRAAREMDAALFIFEQAVAEALYAAQPPVEYTAAVLAAALREGHEGPVFLQ